MPDFLKTIDVANFTKTALKKFGMKSLSNLFWPERRTFENDYLQVDLGLEFDVLSPSFTKFTVAFDGDAFFYNPLRRRFDVKTFQTYNLLPKNCVPVTLSERGVYIPMFMGNATDFVKKIKFYGGHYNQLSGLYPMGGRKNTKVAVRKTGAYTKEKFDLENSTAVVEDNVVINAVQVDLRLENTDVIDFLSHQFGSWYGWISTGKRIVLHGLSYERIWASIGNEDDAQWLVDSTEAMSYFMEFWLHPSKKVNAIGSVLHVRNHFVIIAVHLGGTRGKLVTIYDSMGGREELNELAVKVGQPWHHFLVLKDANVDAGWNLTVKPFHEQADGVNCGVFALVHALQFMKVVFKAGIRKVGLTEERFQVVRPRTVQLSVSADATIAKHLDEVSDVQVDINDDESVEEGDEVIYLTEGETTKEEST
eukprot:augustus_masked-scaffold_76-processed-gene-0.82-mRNA-1 protein AED:1.00 eAED:1.00 QI:0/0/0/0/1/1/3/0/420